MESLYLQKKNGFRAEMAKLEAEAKSIENEAAVAAETSRAIAEQELQRLRGELEQLRLQVETVLPAEAAAQARALRARGEAAPTIENGKATAEALAALSTEWAAAGVHGRDVYVLQQLDALVASAVRRVAMTEIGVIDVVDGGDGESLTTVMAGFSRGVARVLEETGHAVGVDVRALISPHRPGSGEEVGR